MLTDALKATIQSTYRQFLTHHDAQARQGQKLMIANISNTLATIKVDDNNKRLPNNNPHICVIEAGTGTGKTVAYLLASIPIAQASKKKCIVSTATVALQEQIIHKDLPEIKYNTDLDFNFILAKGRGRYLCLNKLDRALIGKNQGQLDFSAAFYDQMPIADDKQKESTAWTEGHEIIIKYNTELTKYNYNSMQLEGKHNMYNTMAAGIIGSVMDLRKETD